MSLIDSLGGGDFNPSFRFAKPGDVVVGTIAETPRQVTTINDEGKSRDFGIGDLLQITLTGYGTASKPGFSPPGLYEAAYKVAAPVSDDPFAGL